MDATNGNDPTQRERQRDDLAARIADHLLSRPAVNALMTPHRDPHVDSGFVKLGKMGEQIPLNQYNDFAGYTKAVRNAAGKAGVHRHHATSGTSTNAAIDKSGATLMTLQYELYNDHDVEQSSHSATSAGTPEVAAALKVVSPLIWAKSCSVYRPLYLTRIDELGGHIICI